jgi:hypothetical protein
MGALSINLLVYVIKFDMLGRVRESYYSLHLKRKVKMLSRTTDDYWCVTLQVFLLRVEFFCGATHPTP